MKKYISLFVVLSVLFIVGFGSVSAKAADISAMESRLQALMQQLQALQSQFNQQSTGGGAPVTGNETLKIPENSGLNSNQIIIQVPSTSTPELGGGPSNIEYPVLNPGAHLTWCYTFNANLGIGSTGAEVSALETALNKEGLGNLTENNYDDTLASAVSGFQEKYRSDILTPNGLNYGTGYVGPSTRAKLNSLYGCNNSVISPLPLPPTVAATTTAMTRQQLIQQISNVQIAIARLTPDQMYMLPLLQAQLTQLNNQLQQFPTNTTSTPSSVTTSTSASSSVTVISPNGGENFVVGGPISIKWSALNTPSNAVAIIALQDVNNVNTYLVNSSNWNGQVTVPISAGSYTTNIPTTVNPGQYKIRVACGTENSDSYCASNISDLNALSNNYFTISAATTTPSSLTINSVSYSQATGKGEIIPGQVAYIYGSGFVASQYVVYLEGLDGQGSTKVFAQSINSSEMDFTVSSSLSGKYALMVGDYPVDNVYSNTVNVSVVAPSVATTTAPVPEITVLTPYAGANFTLGSYIPITWDENYDAGQSITVYLYSLSTTANVFTSQNLIGMQGNDGWNLAINPDLSAGQYRVRVCDNTKSMLPGPVVLCGSSQPINIVAPSVVATTTNSAPSVTITSPLGGSNYTAGQTIPIAWQSTGDTYGKVNIQLWQYYSTGGRGSSPAVTVSDNGSGTYNLVLPANQPAGTYSVSITLWAQNVTGWSGQFGITAPSVATTTANNYIDRNNELANVLQSIQGVLVELKSLGL